MAKRRMFNAAQLTRMAEYTAKDRAETKAAIQNADGDEAFEAAMTKHKELMHQDEVIQHNLAVEAAGPTTRVRAAGKKTDGKTERKKRAPKAEKVAPTTATPSPAAGGGETENPAPQA